MKISNSKKEAFYQPNSVRIKVGCFRHIENCSNIDSVIVGGTVEAVTQNNGNIFVGSRVIAFVRSENCDFNESVCVDPTRVVIIPDEIKIAKAVSVAKYLCKINAIRECRLPMCSSYALYGEDDDFDALLKAMGYSRDQKNNPDLIVDLENLTKDQPAKSGVVTINWVERTEKKECTPGADWDMMMAQDYRRLKYPDAYIHTRVLDNVKALFLLIKENKLTPCIEDIVVLVEEKEKEGRSVDLNLSEFSPYENLIANRMKPMVAVCVVSADKNEIDRLVQKIDSWIGYEHTVYREAKDNIKLGYPDGSIADIVFQSISQMHVELHFGGITILHENGVTKKF